MHRIATQDGAFSSEKPYSRIEHTPAKLIFLSATDTDLVCVAKTWRPLFSTDLRIAHLNQLQNLEAMQEYAHRILEKAEFIIIRLLGGISYFSDLVQELVHLKRHQPQLRLVLLSGTETWDADLLPYNDFSEQTLRSFFAYFREGGIENIANAGKVVASWLAEMEPQWSPCIPIPEYGWYFHQHQSSTKQARVWILFYSAWYQTKDTQMIDVLIEKLQSHHAVVKAFYAYSLRNPNAQESLLEEANQCNPDVILTLQSFSLGLQDSERVSFLETLGCPILQIAPSTQSKHAWDHNPQGFTPSEVAMNVALPEVDGRVFAGVSGFKEKAELFQELQFTTKHFVADSFQCERIIELAMRYSVLRKKANSQKKIAIILANYPNKNSRLGNGVGLDTPQSIVDFLQHLQSEHYQVGLIPKSGTDLIRVLQEGITNDTEANYGKSVDQSISNERLQTFIESLSTDLQEKLSTKWSHPRPQHLPIAGKQWGHIFVGIQPQRGFGIQTQAIYHDPQLPPPPEYLAFYLWIREIFQADAVIHFGKHGNLEWLPGKSVALGEHDFPNMVLGAIPHFYPFIVNDPGEGTQAKRRTNAVIIDHLTPPLTRAGLYHDLDRVERLLEEHAHCETLYPERAHELEHEIEHLVQEATWKNELPPDHDLLNALSNHLCEVKESQIRSGLHIFGRLPEGEQKLDFLLSLVRMPSAQSPGLLTSLMYQVDEKYSPELDSLELNTLPISQRDQLHQRARAWIQEACEHQKIDPKESDALQEIRQLLYAHILPRFQQCELETQALSKALCGEFVPPGSSGAPTRGRLDVLPTGRNFFSIDPRAIPTPSAWKYGKKLADKLVERHLKEENQYPQTVAMVIWGTSNMRTGGDDIAQALWLWGCEPVWEPVSGRMMDFTILPVHLLGRPRVDVTLRASGLFRDAFADTIRLLATIPKRLAQLEEPLEMNPIRANALQDQKELLQQGFSVAQAQRLAGLRVFSSGPGCYGSGLLPLLESGHWKTQKDLTDVFLKWGSHAYEADGSGSEQTTMLQTRLTQVEVVHQNQDNREHDILDSDDYFQFQGGLHSAVKELRGEAPKTYHGDSSNPEQMKIRTLQEEFNLVFRSRVLNPKWIEAMKKHGYKGAFEMAATMDYIFGYDATCDIVQDYQYEEIANTLFLDQQQQEFFQEHNPQALQDSIGRLLEAHERKMWKEASASTIEQLELTLLELQGQLE